MKKLLFILFSVLLFSSCRPLTDSDSSMQANQEKLMSKADRGIGMPSIKNFQERKLAKMIFELRDREDLVCYAYIVNHMTGKLVFLGKCIGYGLPYSIQYTNPEKRRDG